MDSFYAIVLTITIILFIIILTIIGILMNKGNKNVSFPPTYNKCPDNWAISTDASCIVPDENGNYINNGTTGNLGELPSTDGSKNSFQPFITKYNDSTYLMNPDDALWSSFGQTKLCSQYTWANNNNISWDGISNFNSCN